MALRRANDTRVETTGRLLGRRHHIHVGRDTVFTLGARAYRRARAQLEAHGATPVGWAGTRTLWMTTDGFYWDDEGLDAEAVALLAWDRLRRRDAQIDRLRTIRAREEEVGRARRARIPDEVRAFAWERDGGACVRCGTQDDLQFDHVIPVARGGGNAPDNIQILCGDCNRLKSDSIV